MISFRPMRADEYSAYLDYFIPDYASEIAANYGLSDAEARARAISETDEDLPQGVATAGHVLLCIISGGDTLVGYLWYRPDLAARSAHISDFHIFAGQQGKGYGKQALVLLEAELAGSGFTQIRLRVAGNNNRAKHVYDVSGFRVTGINMSKSIGQ
ncbi:GNAT family N-acetyltransferase [Phyllobacterium zundukense]|uniref:GNAT family N-acetyltransferase n=1 Tax=Phyllobacterium zundukense TaxID=1867719 RepID=A0A2N9VZ74_9HYPH|nr:GNAT family N-acetyltransferase [Phyllobacterium zundukense]ATU90949.1 GNAT family N-acetyltransferase [Phyllobacterium zundukense]PIO44792.1 GNAT family N-acetyltransferase [Phyllobacterium zundukense]